MPTPARHFFQSQLSGAAQYLRTKSLQQSRPIAAAPCNCQELASGGSVFVDRAQDRIRAGSQHQSLLFVASWLRKL
jgi:hypothetical protein